MRMLGNPNRSEAWAEQGKHLTRRLPRHYGDPIKHPENTLKESDALEGRLAQSGLRLTRQRRQIYDVVAQSHDHPTAEEIFKRAKSAMPEISFATVYNCLGALAHCGLIRQVILDRAHTRFCPNMREHCHFYCEQCGEVTDIELANAAAIPRMTLPPGYEITHLDLSLKGVCPKCGQAKN